jgi:hypothetical protein
MKTRATLIDAIATVGFLVLAVPAASPASAEEQSSKVQQPHNVTGLSEQRDKTPQTQQPTAPNEGSATTDRMHGSSEGSSDDQRKTAPRGDLNTGVMRPNDTSEQQGSRQN